MPSNTCYAYTAKHFDTPHLVAAHFGITVQQILALNPQWKNRVVVFLAAGEEVVMPDILSSSLMLFLFKSALVVKQRKTADQNQPKTYPANRFPPQSVFIGVISIRTECALEYAELLIPLNLVS